MSVCPSSDGEANGRCSSSQSRHLLVTGGCGFIGSHTVVSLLQAGHSVTVLDNLCNSSPVVLERIAALCDGRKPRLYQVDLRDGEGMERMFRENKFDACIHFAGLKVSETSSGVQQLSAREQQQRGQVRCAMTHRLSLSSLSLFPLLRPLASRAPIRCCITRTTWSAR